MHYDDEAGIWRVPVAAPTPKCSRVLELIDQFIAEGLLDADDLRVLARMASAEAKRLREAGA